MVAIVSLNSIELDEQTLLVEANQSHSVLQSTIVTIGGRTLINDKQLIGGRKLTLRADEDKCWYSKATVEAIIAIANIPNITYSLVHPDYKDGLQVMFNHDSTPAVEFEELWQGAGKFIGSIKLITISTG